MNIPANIKTPGVYTSVNLSAQRTGLPANVHKVLFITPDQAVVEDNGMPVDIYDKAGADVVFGADSVMGRMMTAAIKTNRTVGVQGVGKLHQIAE